MNITEAKKFCQELIDLYVEQGNLRPVKLQIKDNHHGRATYNTRTLVIPFWLFNLSKKGYTKRTSTLAYRYYYVLHEISHFVEWDKYKKSGHQGMFRNVERKLLNDFGLIPVYSRAYVKQLLFKNGEIAYNGD